MESKATQIMVMFIAMVNISIALTGHKGNAYFYTYYLFSMYVKLTEYVSFSIALHTACIILKQVTWFSKPNKI